MQPEHNQTHTHTAFRRVQGYQRAVVRGLTQGQQTVPAVSPVFVMTTQGRVMQGRVLITTLLPT